LPPAINGDFLVLVWIPGVGWRWTVIDTELQPEHPIAQPPLYPDHSLPEGQPRPDNTLPGQGRPPRPDNTLPGSGGRPDNTLPPTAQPKT
jgi:hypothetical protein